MPLTEQDIPTITLLAQQYYDPFRGEEAKQKLAQLSVAPQNVDDFVFLLKNTTDIHLMQFVIQSLRRIVIKFHTHLTSNQVVPIVETILNHLKYHSEIPHSTLSSLSLLFGTIIRFFWVSLPEIRTFVADGAGLLQHSPSQCHSACVLLTELVDEISSPATNSVATNNMTSSVSSNQSITVPFATNMIPAIVVAASSVLYQLLSLFGYPNSPRYIQSGHTWQNFPLTSQIEFNTSQISPQIAKTLISQLITLIYRCIKFDGTGYGGKDEEEMSTTFFKPSAWAPLYDSNFLLLLTISAAEACHDDVKLVQTALQLMSCYISVKTSTWRHSVHQAIACKYSSIFVVMILDSLSRPSNPSDPSSKPVFITQTRLFTAATGLLKAILKGFSVLDIINSFHPLIPCDINFDSFLLQQGTQLQSEINSFFAQTFKPLEGIHREQIESVVQYNTQNPQNQQKMPTLPLISDPTTGDIVSNISPQNANLTIYNSTATTPYQTATLLSHKEHPCRLFQQAMFNAWLHRIYDFTLKVYSLGFNDATISQNSANVHNSGSQPSALSISDLTPQSLLTETCQLGDINLTQMLDVYNHLLSLWHSLAEAYTTAIHYAPIHSSNNTQNGLNSANNDLDNEYLGSGGSSYTSTSYGGGGSMGMKYLRGYNNAQNGPNGPNSSILADATSISNAAMAVWPKSTIMNIIPKGSKGIGSSYSSRGAAGRRNGIVSSSLLGMLNEIPLLESSEIDLDMEFGLINAVTSAIGHTNEKDDVEMGKDVQNGSNTSQNTPNPPPTFSTAPLPSLQAHLDAVIALVMDYRHYDDLVKMLPQVLPQISISYLRAMISSIGAFFDDASFQDICYSDVEALNELFFGSHVLREQLAVFAVIARAVPVALSNCLKELWDVLERAYLQQLSLLPQMAHRLTYELNVGAHQLINSALRDSNNNNNNNNNNLNNNNNNLNNNNNNNNNNVNNNSQPQTSPFSIYSNLLTTLFSSQHEDRRLININDEEKVFITQLFRLESQVSFILCLITTLFQPKHNFFTHKIASDFDIITSIHVQAATLLSDVFRYYTVRYGHYNISSTPHQYQSYPDLTPKHISSLSLETLLAYLTTTPGLCPQPLSQKYVATKFNIPPQQQNHPFFGLSTPLFIIPPSSYLAHSLLNGIGAFTDSLVYRQYLYRSQSYASSSLPNTKNFSDQILSQTFAALAPHLICYSANSDVPPPPANSNTGQGNDGVLVHAENIFGQKLPVSPPKSVISAAYNAGQVNQVIGTHDSPLFLLVNTDGGVTFHEVVNLAVFFSLHVLNLYPLQHTFCVPNLEIAISFLSHLTNTITLAIFLTSLPAWKILMKHFHMLAITRLPSSLPLHSTFSLAIDTFDFDSVIQIPNPSLLGTDPSSADPSIPPQLNQLRYNQRLIWSLPVFQAPHEALLRTIKAAIPYYNPLITSSGADLTPTLKHSTTSTSMGGFRVDFKTCLQLYYELVARATKKIPAALVTPFDSMFGAIALVLDRPNHHSNNHDHSLFAATVNLICNSLTGAGRTSPGEHIYDWVNRFIPLLIRIGMSCSATMYIDRSVKNNNTQIVNGNSHFGNGFGHNGANSTQNGQNGQNVSNPSQTNSNSYNSPANLQGGLEIDSIINALDRIDGLDDDGDDASGGEYFRAVKFIRVEPLIAQAMTNTLAFITTCCANRRSSYSLVTIVEQSVSLVLAFFNSTKAIYSKYINLDSTDPSSIGSFHSHLAQDGSFKHIPFNSSSPQHFEEVSSSSIPFPETRILYPYHNEHYLNCLAAALTLSSELIHTTVATNAGAGGGLDSESNLPPRVLLLIPEVLTHLYHIPIPVLISNLELVEEVLGLISNLFRSLMQTVLMVVHPGLILHYVHLLFALIDAYQHVPVTHPHYTTLALAATCLHHFYSHLPQTLPQIEITAHDCVYHITQNHVAPNYFAYLSDAMINGTSHAINNAWQGILRHNSSQLHLQQQNPGYQTICYPVESVNPSTPVLFRTETLQHDQNSILSILSFLGTHSIDDVIPEGMVTYFGRSNTQQRLLYTMQRLQSNPSFNVSTGQFNDNNSSLGEANAAQNELLELQAITTRTMLTNLNGSPQHQVDLPLMNTVLQSNNKPYPLSSSTTTVHSIKVLRRIIAAIGGNSQNGVRNGQNGPNGSNFTPNGLNNLNSRNSLTTPTQSHRYSSSNRVGDDDGFGDAYGDGNGQFGDNLGHFGTNLGEFGDFGDFSKPLDPKTATTVSKQLVTITFTNMLNHILFDSDCVSLGSGSSSGYSNAAPCLLRLVPLFIHFHPEILKLYVSKLISNISFQSCSVANLDPSLVATRIQQQGNVTQVWATATVTGLRGLNLPPMTVINLPSTTPNGSSISASRSSSSTSGGLSSQGMASGSNTGEGYGVTSYEVCDLVDFSTSHMLILFAKIVAGVVNKPAF